VIGPTRRPASGRPATRSLRSRIPWLLAALLCVAGLSQPAVAATANVAVRDNRFDPLDLHIDPGDRVEWKTAGFRAHTVTSDARGLFDSGSMRSGDSFSRRFNREGLFPYFCRFHGRRGGVGMSGVIIVGEPGGGAGRRRIRVPQDFRTIQRAVTAAPSGSTIIVAPGVYRESVTVSTPDLVIRGIDRFRTVVTGEDTRTDGFLVTVDDVMIKNLTVRRFLNSGVTFSNVTGYTLREVDSIKNRTFGIHAVGSFDGVIADSFAWGSGDSAYRVEGCVACSTIIDGVKGQFSYLGYAGVNSTGVVVRDSLFRNNGVGLAAMSAAGTDGAPNRGTTLLDNVVNTNDYTSVPAAGLSEVSGIPFGTGVWLAGTRNALVRRNRILDHPLYGVLVTESMDGNFAPANNTTVANEVEGPSTFSLAWDGAGDDNCFSENAIDGSTGPSDIQDVYGCDDRPFSGTPFLPVADQVADSLTLDPNRVQAEPPNPNRPRCQKGVPGCRR
jgi:plastocyanin